MKFWEKTYLIRVNSSISYWKFIIKVNNRLFCFLLRLKIDCLNIAKLYCLQQGKEKYEILSIYFPSILYEFQRYFLEKPYQCLFFKCFLTDCLSMLEKFYIIFVVLQKIITTKDAILHVKKIMLLLFTVVLKSVNQESNFS